jgi:N-carbamoyl-D-amino-acid hydrolase
MPRHLTVGAAQMGPIQKSHTRRDVVERLIAHLREAKRMGCELVVFPELTLTTFFPRWFMTDQAEVDAYFEREMPSNETAPLFNEARAMGIGFSLGYAELIEQDGRIRHFNTSILVERDGRIVGKYRKVHLPGHAEHEPERAFQHLEKRYFEVGDLGFPVSRAFGGIMGMCICNDRRWPETYRVMGLQGVEMVMLGYNTPIHNPAAPEQDEHVWFHNQLSMQAGAYQNGTWVVGVAKGGNEEGVPSVADTMIIAPSGKVVARAEGVGDELIVHRCDLDAGKTYKTTIFNFAAHRRPEAYGLIVERTGAIEPPPTTVAFERSHDILIDAPPQAVMDYVSNPNSWPEWLAASHRIDAENRPLVTGETFHERWHTRTGEVRLDWKVTQAEQGRLWMAETNTSFIGRIVARYTFEPVDKGTRYTRTVVNPARPKAPTDDMIRRMDEEAAIGLANIKANVERRQRGG